ncbi:MAG: hypothetical protein WB558_07955 [Terriglobales bacterium]
MKRCVAMAPPIRLVSAAFAGYQLSAFFIVLSVLNLWHNWAMRGRASKGDVAQNALRVVEEAIGGPLKVKPRTLEFPPRKKNPAAVALSKLGSRKGGIARAKKLTPAERKEIAQRAAQARWGQRKVED